MDAGLVIALIISANLGVVVFLVLMQFKKEKGSKIPKDSLCHDCNKRDITCEGFIEKVIDCPSYRGLKLKGGK